MPTVVSARVQRVLHDKNHGFGSDAACIGSIGCDNGCPVDLRGSLHVAPHSATTGTMTGTNTKLTAAVEAYFADLARVRASGGATGERSSYEPLANLLNAVGAALKPKVFCVGELADQGAGHPDFGLYAAKQVQKGRPREGQTPERGVIEVKVSFGEGIGRR